MYATFTWDLQVYARQMACPRAPYSAPPQVSLVF